MSAGYVGAALPRGPKQSAANSFVQAQSGASQGQRKWRVLLSVGLLLPALAAIIGIVAWAISVEVASGSAAEGAQAAAAGHSQRRQQQPAAATLYRHFRRQQPAAELELELSDALGAKPVAAAVVGRPARGRDQPAKQNPPSESESESESESGSGSKSELEQRRRQRAKQRARPELKANARPKSNQNQNQNQNSNSNPNSNQSSSSKQKSKTKSESGQSEGEGEKQGSKSKANSPRPNGSAKLQSSAGNPIADEDDSADDSTLLLTNLDQVGAISGSTAPPAATTPGPQSSDLADGAEQEPAGGSALDQLERVASSPTNPRAGEEPEEGSEKGAEEEEGALRAAEPEEETGIRESKQAANLMAARMAKNVGNKSHWLNGEKASSEGPIKRALKAQKARRLAMKKLNQAYKWSRKEEDEDQRDAEAGGEHESGAAATADRKPQQVGSASEAKRTSANIMMANGGRPSNSRYIILNRSGGGSNSEIEDGAQKAEPSSGEPASNPLVMGERGRAPEGANGEPEPHKSEQERRQEDELSFEAIASAISTSLSASSQPSGEQARFGAEMAEPLEGDTGLMAAAEETRTADEPTSGSLSAHSANPNQANPKRRTAGEHVAEVIDHIVERRNQGERAANPRGPQIVVVAPVGGSGLLKARSLTRSTEGATEPGPAPEQRTVKTRPPVQGDSLESGAKAQGGVEREGGQVNERKTNKFSGKAKLIGARLLGTGDQGASLGSLAKGAKPTINFSEMVEVIEDDDSSAFLMKRPELHVQSEAIDSLKERSANEEEEQEQEAEEEAEEAAAAAAAPAKSPERREVEPSNADGRTVADSLTDQSSIHISSQPGQARHRSPRHESSAGQTLERYTSQAQANSVGANEGAKLYSTEQLIRNHVLKSKSRDSAGAQTQTMVAAAPKAEARADQQRPLKKAGQLQASAAQQGHQQQMSASQQQVKVSPTTTRPHASSEQSARQGGGQRAQQDSDRPAGAAGQKQPLSSGIRSIQIPLLYQQRPTAGVFAAPRQQTETYQTMESQQAADYQQPQAQLQANYLSQAHNTQPNAHQQQQANNNNNLPIFADQEFNVPAHLAESVIQDIQRSPSTMGLVGGQPALVSNAGQVPHLNQQHLMSSSPFTQSMYLASQQQQQAWNQQQLAAANLYARFANGEQQQQHPMMLGHQQARHVLANRNGVETPQPPSSVKQPRGLVHPVAQMALRHLFSSLGQQSSVSGGGGQQAAAEPASGGQSRPAIAAAAAGSAAATPSEHLQALGSAPAASAALPPPVPALELAGRTMRSLPIGGSPAEQQQQQQLQASDQEVQESYGQMPAYHMPAAGYGHQQHYGADHYQSEHDKKSKGITFHFGGGPIGGGTQLITSPMGIFKHLMIPLLPNPRVNLNGKVVFGVVLEKSTAFGEPKKKYKFWGR